MDYNRLINECPTVIGMITSTLESGGSIDTAIRSIACYGPKYSRILFIDAVRIADTKGCGDLPSGLVDRLMDLPEKSAGYRRALTIAISAAGSSSDEERNRLLRDAAEIALESVNESGESYGSSLTVPCMTIFGLGIMVPMILMSVLPMMNIGGLFGTKTFDQNYMVLITLVIIPAAILMLSIYLRNNNPFLLGDFCKEDLKNLLPLLAAIPLAIACYATTKDVKSIPLFSIAPACILTFMLMLDRMRDESKKSKCELGVMDSIFDIGNRMLSGTNFETATCESLSNRKDCHALSDSLSKEFSLCRGDINAAVEKAISPISKEMSIALCDINVCASKDNEDAGRLAVSLGKQFQSRNTTKKSLESKLKSMTDMMLGTAAVFAPMVLGLSIAMLGPLSRISKDISVTGTSLILEAYLVELCALISILVSSIGDGDGPVKTVWRFCILCPISLIIFSICAMVSL